MQLYIYLYFMRCWSGYIIINKHYDFLLRWLETWTLLVDGVDWANAGRGCLGDLTGMLVGES